VGVEQDVMVAIRAVDKPVSPGRRSAASVANINPELYPDVELEDVESKVLLDSTPCMALVFSSTLSLVNHERPM
jgi:hypothetical protein